MSDSPIISFKSVSVFQREILVLANVNISVLPGEMVYLIGRVGSGKSSLIKTMNAEIPIFDGEASIAEYDLVNLKRKEIPFLRRKLGVVFQDFKLLTDRNVFENLRFVLKATGWKDEKEIAEKINDTLAMVGAEGINDKMTHQLSGGEQQRVVVARALLNDPEIILADEPTGNLDYETSESIMKLFTEINKKGITIIMATHDKLVLDQFPARTLVCADGKLHEKHAKEIIDFRSILKG